MLEIARYLLQSSKNVPGKRQFDTFWDPRMINSIWNNEELPQQWKESIIVPTYMRGYKTE
jgi:hypothetical protein